MSLITEFAKMTPHEQDAFVCIIAGVIARPGSTVVRQSLALSLAADPAAAAKLRGVMGEPAPTEVDPDEALAKVIQAAYFVRRDWLHTARAAREHIEANERHEYDILMRDRNEQVARAEKAEADLARVTALASELERAFDTETRRADRAEGLHKALRDDVEKEAEHWHGRYMDTDDGTTKKALLVSEVADRVSVIVVRDSERVEEGE